MRVSIFDKALSLKAGTNGVAYSKKNWFKGGENLTYKLSKLTHDLMSHGQMKYSKTINTN
jgi:hypothetical protein